MNIEWKKRIWSAPHDSIERKMFRWWCLLRQGERQDLNRIMAKFYNIKTLML